MCRRETNDVHEKVNDKLHVIKKKFILNPSLSIEDRKVNTKEICDMIMSIHYQLQFRNSWEALRTICFEKIEEFSTQGMDGEKLQKQIASLSSRVIPK